MWFLLKGTFWFTMILVVLSYFGGKSQSESANQPGFDVANAFVAVTGTYDYVTGLCREKPDVCEKGAETLHAIGLRAKDGALVAYQLLNEHFGNGTETKSQQQNLNPVNGALPVAESQPQKMPLRNMRENAAAPHGVEKGVEKTSADNSDADQLVTGTVSPALTPVSSNGGDMPLVLSVPKPKPKPAG